MEAPLGARAFSVGLVPGQMRIPRIRAGVIREHRRALYYRWRHLMGGRGRHDSRGRHTIGRTELGGDLVPDYLTSVKDSAFYGWPFSYYWHHVDTRVPPNPDMIAKAVPPDYALGSHVAALGLTFSSGTQLPESFRNGAFVGEHGSWNRQPASGYKSRVYSVFERTPERPSDGYPERLLDRKRMKATAAATMRRERDRGDGQ